MALEVSTLIGVGVGAAVTLAAQVLANRAARERLRFESVDRRQLRWNEMRTDAYRRYLHTSRESTGELGTIFNAAGLDQLGEIERRIQTLLRERRAARADLDLFASERAAVAADSVDDAVDSLGNPTSHEWARYLSDVLGVRHDGQWTAAKREQAKEHFYARTHRELILPAIDELTRAFQEDLRGALP